MRIRIGWRRKAAVSLIEDNPSTPPTFNITDKILNYEKEIKGAMRELKRLNLNNSWFRAHIELLFLQGCLMRAQFDLDGAKELFELTKREAEKHRMTSVAKKAQNALKQLQDQKTSLERLYTVSPQAYRQFQMQEAKSYLKIAQKVLHQTPK